jgi:zinc protease
MNFNKTIFAGALALSLITSGVFAQVKKKPATTTKPAATTAAKGKPAAAATTKPAALPVDPAVIIGKLPNGLTYYIRSNSAPKNRAYLFLVNKAGSVLETDAQQGMAHFVQRLAFDGTKDFSKNEEIAFLGKSGGKFNPDVSGNASYDETIYQMVVPTDTVKLFDTGFKLLANLAGYVTFDAAEAEKEKAVLLQAAQQHGNPQERLEQQTYPVLLANSKYAQRMPLGKEEAIKTFTAAAAKSFYHDWYRPDLQAVIVVGDVDPKNVEQLIKTYFSPLKNPVPEKPRVAYSVPPVPGTTVKIATDKDLGYTAVQIVVKHPQGVIKTPADILQDIRINLFNQMLNTRISETLQQRNPPFAYAQASYGGFAGRQDAFSAIAEAKAGGLEAAVKGITTEIERAKKFGFTLTELERAKQNTLQQMGNMYTARAQANSSVYLAQYIQNFVGGAAVPGVEYTYNYYVNNIGKITIPDMNALAAKFITDQNRVIIIAAPDADKDKLPNEKTLSDWMAEAGKNITAYSDDINTEPLMAARPTPGKVLSRQEDSIISVTRLTLKNGLKVILKPTKFQNNQILINGYSFGGTSLASDKDFVSANMAAGVIGNSGVAKLDQGQLNVKLRTAQINISPYISETTQGISGNSTPADFETAMQLLYLYFTQPRKDAETWQSTMAKTRALLDNKNADPGSVYQDTVTALMSNHNPRAMPTTLDQLNAASLDKAFEFYKDRFADASDFTFTFVGSFANDQILPYIETYLGSLPSDNHRETYRKMNIHPVAGQVSRTIYKGASDKATVQLVFSDTYTHNESNNIQLDALEDILNRRLTARLPEKTSGAYSLSAGINYVKIPQSRYKATISFLCAPADVDKVTNDIMDEISKIKQNGADTTSIKSFIITQSRSIQTQLRQNYFWAGYLASSDQDGEDPDRIIPHIQALNEVTVQTTKDAANKYLSGTNLIKIILLPAKEEKK